MAEKEKTVYILGAGFSRAFSEMTEMEKKFPVMNDFMVDVDNDKFWGTTFPRNSREALVTWIDNHYETREGINIEELMTIFELMREGFVESVNHEEYESQRILADTLTLALRKYIRYRLKSDYVLTNRLKDLYYKWIDSSNTKSIFLSFNYDILFEDLGGQVYNIQYFNNVNFLRNDSIGINSKFEFSDFKNPPLFLYKLHGSLDWYTCSNKNCNQNFRIFSDYQALIVKNENPIRERKYEIPRTFCPICGSNMEFVFIQPQIVKDINKFPKIKLMWRHAAQAIKLCKNIVVIGYSFPQNDTRTTYMMMSALQGREKEVKWTIVDKNVEDVKKRLIEILPKHKQQIENATIFDGNDALLKYLTDFAEKNPAD